MALTDEVIALLTDNPSGLKVSVMVRIMEPKACGQRQSELYRMVDRECTRLTLRGTIVKVDTGDEPIYRMKVI